MPDDSFGTVPTPAPSGCLLPGDVDGDKRITQEDVRLIAARAGARSGDERYEAKYDVVADGAVNVRDTFATMLRVGQTCPN